MSTLNDADLSGGKPAAADVGTNNPTVFGVSSNSAVDSSFALLQQVQSILLENNEAKAKMTELENQVATFKKEREDMICKLDQSQTDSNQTIQSLQEQLSQKEDEWNERLETQERNHQSSLKILQDKLDDWESRHQDWATQENDYQQTIAKLEESQTRLEANVQQLEAALEESKTKASQLHKEQEDAAKTHKDNVSDLNFEIESLRKDLQVQRLQIRQDQQNHEEQKLELQQTVLELRASVQEKDTLVQSFEDTVGQLRLEVSQLKQDHQAQVQDLETTISMLELENIAQSKQAEEYQTQIDKLEKDLGSLNSIFLEQQKEAERKEEKEKQKQDDEQQQLQQEQEDSKWQELVQSLQIQAQAQINIAETKSKELEDSKNQNMELRVQLHVLSQQKEQLERNWTETKERLKSLQGRVPNSQEEEKTNSNDSSQGIARLTEENKRLNERIVQMEAQLILGSARGMDRCESKEDYCDHGNTTQGNKDDTVAQLQQRIMQLVEEKLILQTAVETLEHQVVELEALGRNASSRQLQEKQSALSTKEYRQKHQLQLQQEQEGPTIVVDENTKQADIIRQTMEHQKSQKLTGRISKKVLGTAPALKPIRHIDVKATERLFLEQKQKEEFFRKAQNGNQTKLINAHLSSGEIGRNNWIRSRDHGMDSPQDATTDNGNGSADLPEYMGSNQQGFIQSAMRTSSNSANKKEKTTTWTRIRDSIAGPKTSESDINTEPTNVDHFSLWVQELSHEQQLREGKESKQPEEFKSLSEPASMLDSLPNVLSSNAGRYAVQTIDDLLKGDADAIVGGFNKNPDIQPETIHNQTYRVVDPIKSKPMQILSKIGDEKAAIGAGKAIDQSNLLGFYVNKQKEAVNSTTIGYLSNIIYGDPDEEEAKIQQKLLKRQLAKKKKQEQQERANLEKEVQSTILNKPKTVFSSFI